MPRPLGKAKQDYSVENPITQQITRHEQQFGAAISGLEACRLTEWLLAVRSIPAKRFPAQSPVWAAISTGQVWESGWQSVGVGP